LEPQIVMNAPRVVLLDDELPAFAAADLRLRFGGAGEVALLLVGRERIPARRRPRSFPARCHDRVLAWQFKRSARSASRSISEPAWRATPTTTLCPVRDSVASSLLPPPAGRRADAAGRD